MIVDLNSNYRVRTKPGNFILEKVLHDQNGEVLMTKTGRQRVKILGFFNNMQQALHESLQYDMEDNHIRISIQEYCRSYQQEVESLNQLLPEVGRDTNLATSKEG